MSAARRGLAELVQRRRVRKRRSIPAVAAGEAAGRERELVQTLEALEALEANRARRCAKPRTICAAASAW
jgi:hypothetical protein